MSGDGEDWSPSRPFWRGGSTRRLGPSPAPIEQRAFSPTLDRLPGEARSVRVPAIFALGGSVMGVVVMIIGLVAIGMALARADVTDDLDNIGAERTDREIEACAERQRDLDNAHRAYVRSTGDQPQDIDDLDVGASDFVIGRDGRPVPAPGSRCEGVADGDVSTGDAVGDRAGLAAEEVVGSVGVVLLILGGLAYLATPGMLSWWLATAYRSLPKAVRHHSSRRAYALIRTFAVCAPIVVLCEALISTYVEPEDELLALVLSSIVQLAYTIILIRALFVVLDLMEAVTFEFCNRHYGTSRAMRICVWAWLLLPFVAAGLVGGAIGARNTAWAATVLLLAAVALLIGALVVAPIVFVVCLFVAVVMATAGIDRTLAQAAREIEVAEAEGRVLPTARQSALV